MIDNQGRRIASIAMPSRTEAVGKGERLLRAPQSFALLLISAMPSYTYVPIALLMSSMQAHSSGLTGN